MTRNLLRLALLGLVLINTVVVAQDNNNTGTRPDVGDWLSALSNGHLFHLRTATAI